MPTLESLNTLKRQINALGGEPRILSERGETIADVAPPHPPPPPPPEPDTDLEPTNGGTREMEALFGSFDDDSALDTDDFDTSASNVSPRDERELGTPAPGEPMDTAGLELGDGEELLFDDSGEIEDSEAVPIQAAAPDEFEEAEDVEALDAAGDQAAGDQEASETPAPGMQQPESPGEGSIEELTLDDSLNFDEEIGADALSDIRDIEDDSQQFSMDDFGEEYNFAEGDSGLTDDFGVESLERSLDEAAEDEVESFSISENDLALIQDTLRRLPRNLKLAVEELLADDRRGPEVLQPLIDSLINGEAPRALAARFYRITKRRIELPRGFERKSGRALELRRQSLSYRLMREGWPVLRTVFGVITVTWILGAAVFMWVYRPLKAASLYRDGLEDIAADDIEGAVVKFRDAWDGWPLFGSREDEDRIADAPIVVKGWKDASRWLDYARTLRRRKHWDSADRFYVGYLAAKPADKNARLEYAEFLSSILGRFESAIKILESAPSARWGQGWDRDYTLAAGDVHLQWAEEDPAQFESARLRYAEALERSRNDERAILSMMRYHLKIGDSENIRTLLPIFLDEKPGRTDEPELAAEVFAELAEYHLARGDTGESLRFVTLARAADPGAPEPFFAEARYRRIMGDEFSELNAYRQTLVNLSGREFVNRDHLKMKILSLAGIGRISAAAEYSTAMNSYAKAVKIYEEARSRGILGASPEYGRIYLELGDIVYRGRGSGDDLTFTLTSGLESQSRGPDRSAELELAEAYYTEAEALFSRTRGETGLPAYALYRRAYARYMLGRNDALIDFYRVVRRRPDDYESRMALAGVLLRSGDYEASRSQYTRAVELLDGELSRSGGVLAPNERQSHKELLLRYIAAWNNMGVGRARSAARGSGDNDYAEALSAFTIASDYQDRVSTDMDQLQSRGARALRDSDERRVMRFADARRRFESADTYPYRNRARLLGLEEGEYLAYTNIPSDLITP